jgi:hypothetical protein
VACGVLPVAVYWPLLSRMKTYYGMHFWARPSFSGIGQAYGSLFYMGAALGLAMVSALSVGVAWSMRNEYRKVASAPAGIEAYAEGALALGLLALPILGFVFAKVTHGGMTDRYVLAVALGLALSSGILLAQAGRRSLALVGIFLVVAAFLHEFSFWSTHGLHAGKPASPSEAVETLVQSAGHPELPVVVSDGLEYVPLAYYASPDWRKRFLALVDPPESLVYAGSDSVDKALQALQSPLALQVRDFAPFAAEHPAFLLYSSGSGDGFDWWRSRLAHDGYRFQVAAMQGSRVVYVATRKEDFR